MQITITLNSLKSVENEIAKMNRRIAKRNLGAAITMTVSEPRMTTFNSGKYEVVTIEIACPELKLAGGWKLIGVLDNGGLSKSVPGESIPLHQRGRFGNCDYCNKTRNRTDTFVIKNDEGETMVVGRTCLGDYLGIDPTGVLYTYDVWERLERMMDELKEQGLAKAEVHYDLKPFLMAGSAFIRKNGYVSRARSTDELPPTSQIFWALLNDPTERLPSPTDGDEGLVDAAIEWIENSTDDSEYFFNLRQILKAGTITRKSAGYAISIISTYQRFIGEVKTNAAKALVSDHIGQVKEKLKDLVLTINGIREIDGNYGPCFIVNLTDANGNVCVWFASNDPRERGKKIGETYTATKATVKNHTEFKGVKQTALTRVTW